MEISEEQEQPALYQINPSFKNGNWQINAQDKAVIAAQVYFRLIWPNEASELA